ncbi:MAG: multicopper oxidase domain-containing protein [Gammaproteobacteria bacterium]|nr:multicopper oxidase domain-containing protein [Gammaproteobacteria bacterium]
MNIHIKTATASIPLIFGLSVADAVPVPGGTLDPTMIPKYTTNLLIPPVLYDDDIDDDDDDDDDRNKNGYSKKCKEDKKGKRSKKCDDDDVFKAEVALRQIKQQVLPKGFPKTPLWAYGNPKDPKSFSNPAFTIEVTKDKQTQITWSNQLVKNAKRCVDSSGKAKNACKFLPHIIQDQNGDPIIDQTLHWAAPNHDCLDGMARTDCRGASPEPYYGPIPSVVHVHGAHVGPGSDGYPEAWWLPDASNIDCVNVDGYPATPDPSDDYDCNGTFFESANGADTLNALGEGYAIDIYTNDQPTSTLWYHDHTLGMTRLNVYAAGAGFWLIRDEDDGETGLLSGALPGPAPGLGDNPNCSNAARDACVRNQIREIPIAIQPKSFNADGSQYFPADRQFFEALGDGQTFALNDMMSSQVTADGAFPFLPNTSSDIAPVWNPEAFFNTMVVNGKTWPQHKVAQERYRLRLLNAADSRFLNLSLRVVVDNGADGVPGTADDTLGDELPFYQIGSEQGLLPHVVRIENGFATPLPGDGSDVGSGVTPVPGTFAEQALLIGPAERADVIVDFSGLPNRSIVRMINTAPDAPFGGFPDVPADPGTTGQVMQFLVVKRLNNPDGDPSTPAPSLVLDTNPGGVPKLGAPDAFQDLALLEEESAKICVIFDAVTGAVTHVEGDPLDPLGCPEVIIDGTPVQSEPFGPQAAVLGTMGSAGGEAQLWDDPIAQNPAVDSVELWEMWNWSADAHPIHLHLVKFEVVNREIIGGAVRPPEPWEMGWKDTVIAYPGEVTRVKAKFDIPGLYVWHCHILSHEDNEMMVPYCVGEPGVDCPAELF